ncbi:MAG TPA: hypothetical protein VKV15_19515 [Bryobacteraceae bacterium]|nr:hypothetical protein [Bryobacteraceae bacterium]
MFLIDRGVHPSQFFFAGKGTAYGKQFYIEYLSEVTTFAAETGGKDSATTVKPKLWAFWQ